MTTLTNIIGSEKGNEGRDNPSHPDDNPILLAAEVTKRLIDEKRQREIEEKKSKLIPTIENKINAPEIDNTIFEASSDPFPNEPFELKRYIDLNNLDLSKYFLVPARSVTKLYGDLLVSINHYMEGNSWENCMKQLLFNNCVMLPASRFKDLLYCLKAGDIKDGNGRSISPFTANEMYFRLIDNKSSTPVYEYLDNSFVAGLGEVYTSFGHCLDQNVPPQVVPVYTKTLSKFHHQKPASNQLYDTVNFDFEKWVNYHSECGLPQEASEGNGVYIKPLSGRVLAYASGKGHHPTLQCTVDPKVKLTYASVRVAIPVSSLPPNTIKTKIKI